MKKLKMLLGEMEYLKFNVDTSSAIEVKSLTGTYCLVIVSGIAWNG
jgi:hypothetical protein